RSAHFREREVEVSAAFLPGVWTSISTHGVFLVYWEAQHTAEHRVYCAAISNEEARGYRAEQSHFLPAVAIKVGSDFAEQFRNKQWVCSLHQFRDEAQISAHTRLTRPRKKRDQSRALLIYILQIGPRAGIGIRDIERVLSSVEPLRDRDPKLYVLLAEPLVSEAHIQEHVQIVARSPGRARECEPPT